jgi:hypothetical protein
MLIMFELQLIVIFCSINCTLSTVEVNVAQRRSASVTQGCNWGLTNYANFFSRIMRSQISKYAA